MRDHGAILRHVGEASCRVVRVHERIRHAADRLDLLGNATKLIARVRGAKDGGTTQKLGGSKQTNSADTRTGQWSYFLSKPQKTHSAKATKVDPYKSSSL